MDFAVKFTQVFFELLSLIIIIRVLMSWFRTPSGPGPLGRFIIDTSQPILNAARKITPKTGMVDISPIIALVAINIIESILLEILRGF